MFRPFFTAAIIAAYVAGQLAAAPHLHARSPAGHDRQPHIHTHFFLSLWVDHQPRHDHHEHGSGHEHHPHDQSHSHNSHQSAPPGPPDGGHDTDCIYLSDHPVAAPLNACHDFLQASGDVYQLEAIPGDAPELAPFCSTQIHAPPDLLAGGCALFLKLRTLRI